MTFDKVRDDGKGIPWDIVGPAADGNKFMRIRIDSDPAIRTILVQQGYINQGQVIPPDEMLLIFADVFPDDQIEIAANFPLQFRRLCELLANQP